MIPAALCELARQFTLLKLNVCVQLQDDATLPSFKGSMLHGWFGHALKQASERAFHICYGEHDQQQPKPYMICPSTDHKTHWKRNEILDFELCLFGGAIALTDDIFKALVIGEKNGLGPQRVPFKVISVSSFTPTGLKAGAHSYSLLDWINQRYQPSPLLNDAEVAINLLTPLRLKLHGNIVKTPPVDAQFWTSSILRRVQQLSRYWVVDSETLFEQITQDSQVTQQIELTSHCYVEDWQRFSLKQAEQLPFGGLKGQIRFFGQIHMLHPLLLMAEQIHLGGKTTFGLGKIQLISP
jgi:hypothetical protein